MARSKWSLLSKSEKKVKEQAGLILQLQRQYNGMSAFAGELLEKIAHLERLNAQHAEVIRLMKQASVEPAGSPGE